MYMTRNKTNNNVSKLNISKMYQKKVSSIAKICGNHKFDHHITCICRKYHNDFILIVFHF